MARILVGVWQAIITFLHTFGRTSCQFLQGMLRFLLVTTQRAAAFITTVWQGIRNWMCDTWNTFTRWCQEIVDWFLNLFQTIKKHLPRKPASWFKLVKTIFTAIILQTSDVGTDYYSGYQHWM